MKLIDSGVDLVYEQKLPSAPVAMRSVMRQTAERPGNEHPRHAQNFIETVQKRNWFLPSTRKPMGKDNQFNESDINSQPRRAARFFIKTPMTEEHLWFFREATRFQRHCRRSWTCTVKEDAS